MGYHAQHILKANIEAIRIALAWQEGDKLTDQQVQALQQYAGFGGIKAVLYPNAPIEAWQQLNATDADLKLYPDMMQLHRLLEEQFTDTEYKQVINSIKNSVLTAFYTPSVLPQTLFKVLKEQGIEPKTIYEPSAGAGIFLTEAAKVFTRIDTITAVEKDLLTGRVLTALASSLPVNSQVQVKGLEATDNKENGQFDLIVSNIPFGNFPVYDRAMTDIGLFGRVHNYFFAKGLDKLREGGMLAYITTDAFLNSPSNKNAREYLFKNADFIAVNVLPDNLMKDTGNTEAPSHLLIVQKHTDKQQLSATEEQLVQTVEQQNAFGTYNLNLYVSKHPELNIGN